jgi:hypothetical protein
MNCLFAELFFNFVLLFFLVLVLHSAPCALARQGTSSGRDNHEKNNKWKLVERWCFSCMQNSSIMKSMGNSSNWASATELQIPSSVKMVVHENNKIIPPKKSLKPIKKPSSFGCCNEKFCAHHTLLGPGCGMVFNSASQEKKHAILVKKGGASLEHKIRSKNKINITSKPSNKQARRHFARAEEYEKIIAKKIIVKKNVGVDSTSQHIAAPISLNDIGCDNFGVTTGSQRSIKQSPQMIPVNQKQDEQKCIIPKLNLTGDIDLTSLNELKKYVPTYTARGGGWTDVTGKNLVPLSTSSIEDKGKVFLFRIKIFF